jgi:transposase
MDQLSELARFSEPEKDALMTALWAEVQHRKARLTALEAKPPEPRKDAHHSSVPPSPSPKANRPPGLRTGTQRAARVGRAGGGRPLHPNPDQIILAQAKTGPHCGGVGPAHAQPLHAVYDTSELPPLKPIVTRVEQHGGACPHGGQTYGAPGPVGVAPGTPFGASIEGLATYRRYTPAISSERLSALVAPVSGVAIRDGALANLFRRVNTRLDHRVAELLTRLRSSRLICSDETGARVHGRTPWEGVFQHAAGCVHGIRPSRGHGVIHAVLGAPRPTIWVSDLYSAHQPHPAAHWHVCLAHQLRDCQFALEAGDTVFAPRMKAVLPRAFAIHKRRDTLAASTLYQYRCDLQRRVSRCLALQSANPHGRQLQKRDAKIQDSLFVFLEDAAIPPTNNSSEQAIRMSTVFRKVTNGFRSEWGRDLFAAVRSVVNTGKRQGLSAYQAIQKALAPIGSLFEPG